MKRIALATATSLLLATSATAGGFAFSLPSLSFPPTADATVAKNCLQTQDARTACTVQE